MPHKDSHGSATNLGIRIMGISGFAWKLLVQRSQRTKPVAAEKSLVMVKTRGGILFGAATRWMDHWKRHHVERIPGK